MQIIFFAFSLFRVFTMYFITLRERGCRFCGQEGGGGLPKYSFITFRTTQKDLNRYLETFSQSNPFGLGGEGGGGFRSPSYNYMINNLMNMNYIAFKDVESEEKNSSILTFGVKKILYKLHCPLCNVRLFFFPECLVELWLILGALSLGGRMVSSMKGCPPSKVFFHQRCSSIKGPLSSKFLFHQMLSYIKECPL